MESTQVRATLQQAESLFNDSGSYQALNTGDVITYLQKSIDSITTDLQLAFDCQTKFKCRGFHVEERIGLQIDLSASLGLESHEGIMRSLLKDYTIAKAAEH
jgi:hypothetical protein